MIASFSLCSVACLFSLFFNTELKISDTILCHFTAVFHVVFRCFIIGGRYVENPDRFVKFYTKNMVFAFHFYLNWLENQL